MKKKVLFVIFVSLIFVIPLTLAANNTGSDDAYACLEDKISEAECSLSVEEKIFSVLAVDECKSELRSQAKDSECWPEDSCNIKTTSQAVLALETGVSDAKDWLLQRNGTPSEITWYLQIDPEEASTCEITYDSDDYTIYIDEDKKLDSNAGSCLSLSSENYWLEVSSSCYDEEFDISCDMDFYTSLLFTKQDSETIHVSKKTSSGSADSTTTEKINSFCFMKEGSCDYEGSLWAALALDSIGVDVSSYIPYLITMAEENDDIFPEPLLYILTNYDEFSADILSKQATSGYWTESRNKFYDTALALYPFQNRDFEAKAKAKEWLLDTQEEDGCWNSGNILDTAFILHSVWPKAGDTGGGDDDLYCEDFDNFCISSADCTDAGGTELDEYSCSSGYSICCDRDKVLESCIDKNGEECETGKQCSSYTERASDTNYCCLDECVDIDDEEFTCVDNNGVCEDDCGTGYEETYEYSCDNYQYCCMEKDTPGPKPIFWILLVLITLVILALIFKNKLREVWFRIKPGKSKPFKRGPGPGLPPVPSTGPRRRIASRHIMPASHRPGPRPAPRPRKEHSELDDVLKKLKDMGK